MITTSYFTKDYDIEHSVSIAGKCPDYYKGVQYKKLAPLYWFFKKYKEDNNQEFYIEQYNNLVLAKLNPEVIYNKLTCNDSCDCILMCWEKPNQFCHRHLVAKWLENNLGITVKEKHE